MAREKPVRSATLEEFEQLRDGYGHLEEVAFGLVAGFVWIRSTGLPSEEYFEKRLAFLNWFLEQEYQRLSCEIYSAAVARILDLFEHGLTVRVKMQLWHWEDKLISFLASQEPLEGMRGRVSSYLGNVAHFRVHFRAPHWGSQERATKLKAVARALLRYKNFDVVETVFVRERVYDVIPPLFEAVVEQVDEENAYCVVCLVMSGWHVPQAVGKAFQLVGDDSRILRLLIDLSQAYLSEHGKPYPLEKSLRA